MVEHAGQAKPQAERNQCTYLIARLISLDQHWDGEKALLLCNFPRVQNVEARTREKEDRWMPVWARNHILPLALNARPASSSGVQFYYRPEANNTTLLKMLSLQERYNILRLLRFFCIIIPFPAQLNVETWQIRHTGGFTKRKAWASKASCLLFILHAVYINLTLIHALFALRTVPLYQLILHAVFASASALYVFWYYILYVRHGNVTAEFRSLTLSMAIVGGMNAKTGKGTRRQSLFARPLEDLMAIYLPHVIIASFALILLTFVYDPSITFLLYSALPRRYQFWLTFCACLMEEFRFVLFIIGIIVPIWQLQVMAFEDINRKLKELINSTTVLEG